MGTEMKTRGRYRNYLSMMAIVVMLVLILFRTLDSRAVAATVAGLLFLSSTLVVLLWEMKQPQFWKSFSFAGSVIFLISSVVPILWMRFANWGVSFSEITFLGLPAQSWHKTSNYIFLLFVILIYVDHVRMKKKSV